MNFMSTIINIPIRELTLENIIDLFKIFCDSFELEMTARDVRFLKNRGFKGLKKEGVLEYRASLGTKFFIQQRGTDSIQVWVNTAEYNSALEQKKKYSEAIIDYFRK